MTATMATITRRLASLLLAGAALATIAAPRALRAQRADPDSLLMSGQLEAAESAYFARAAANPRDPVARAALGRYLGARGAPRVGAVLLEEARYFGGDSSAVAAALVPLYHAMGDYRALATLPASPLSRGERAQAAWLATHPPSLTMDDTATIAYRPLPDGASLGTVTLHLGARTVTATIDPRRSGLVLDPSLARHDTTVKVFRGDSAAAIVGIASTVRLGDVALGNVPVCIEWLGPERAVIGLDVLHGYAPTFDPARGRIVLRRVGRAPADLSGIRLGALLLGDDVRVLWRGKFRSLTSTDVAPTLRRRRWTIDTKRGEIVIG